MRIALYITLIIAFLFSLGCSKSSTSEDSIDYISIGKNLSDDPTFGTVGNPYTCITCHQPPESDRDRADFTYPAVPLRNLYYRNGFWGEYHRSLRTAVNQCIVKYMHGDQLTQISDRWIALEEYLKSTSVRSDSMLRTIQIDTFLTTENLIDTVRYQTTYSGGEQLFGSSTYDRYCNQCHGYGIHGIADLRSIHSLSIGYIAMKTRLSSTNYLNGYMPFFTITRLPVDSLKNIIAFLVRPDTSASSK